MSPHEIQRTVFVELPTLFGVDLSITNEVVLLWLSGLVTSVLLFVACRRKGLVPKGAFANLFEALIEFIERDVARGSIGEKGRTWAPFLMALFFFILFSNLLGLVPDPAHFKAMTANINVTAALALLVFVLTIVVNIRHAGILGFLGRFCPSGIPRVIAVLVIPIEILSWLARPFSLSVRLFANMMVGHYLIFTFLGLLGGLAWFLRPIPLFGAMIMSCFEIFVSLVQAFIFTMLAAMYIKDAVEAH